MVTLREPQMVMNIVLETTSALSAKVSWDRIDDPLINYTVYYAQNLTVGEEMSINFPGSSNSMVFLHNMDYQVQVVAVANVGGNVIRSQRSVLLIIPAPPATRSQGELALGLSLAAIGVIVFIVTLMMLTVYRFKRRASNFLKKLESQTGPTSDVQQVYQKPPSIYIDDTATVLLGEDYSEDIESVDDSEDSISILPPFSLLPPRNRSGSQDIADKDTAYLEDIDDSVGDSEALPPSPLSHLLPQKRGKPIVNRDTAYEDSTSVYSDGIKDSKEPRGKKRSGSQKRGEIVDKDTAYLEDIDDTKDSMSDSEALPPSPLSRLPPQKRTKPILNREITDEDITYSDSIKDSKEPRGNNRSGSQKHREIADKDTAYSEDIDVSMGDSEALPPSLSRLPPQKRTKPIVNREIADDDSAYSDGIKDSKEPRGKNRSGSQKHREISDQDTASSEDIDDTKDTMSDSEALSSLSRLPPQKRRKPIANREIANKDSAYSKKPRGKNRGGPQKFFVKREIADEDTFYSEEKHEDDATDTTKFSGSSQIANEVTKEEHGEGTKEGPQDREIVHRETDEDDAYSEQEADDAEGTKKSPKHTGIVSLFSLGGFSLQFEIDSTSSENDSFHEREFEDECAEEEHEDGTKDSIGEGLKKLFGFDEQFESDAEEASKDTSGEDGDASENPPIINQEVECEGTAYSEKELEDSSRDTGGENEDGS